MEQIQKKKTELAYKLFFEALTCKNLQNLTDAASRILDCPVLINDDISCNLSQAPNHMIGNLDWDLLVQTKRASSEHFTLFYKKYISNSESVTYPILINDGDRCKTPQLFSVLRQKNRVLGYSSVLLLHHTEERDSEISDELLHIIQLFNAAAASILSDTEALIHLEDRRAKELFTGLLQMDEKILPSQQIHIENMKVKYRPSYRLLLSQWTTGTPDDVMVRKLCAHIQKQSETLLAVPFQGDIITLFSRAKRSGTGTEEILLKHLLLILGQYPVRTSVSTVFTGLNMAKQFYQQTLLTMKTGNNLYPENLVYRADELFPLSLFTAFSECYPIAPFIHPLMEIIYQHDKEQCTEYLHTLGVYLKCMLNSREAAKELHIHNNTMLYRIRRMEELFGIDFDKYDLLHALSCNFDLIRALGISYEEARERFSLR